MRTTALLMLAVTGLLSCSRKSPDARDSRREASPAALRSDAPQVDGQGKLDPNDPKHGTRRLMGLDAPVFVDGVQVAVLRYGDMPTFEHETLETGTERFRLYDYLKAIGIAPESIRSLHVHGNGDRIGAIEGSELVKEKARFAFQFTSGTSGAPLQRWSTTGLKNTFVVHEIRRMTIYVNKPVPAIKPVAQCHVGADGECSDAIPYAAGEAAKGTRVYVDGKMVGFVKRRQLGDDLVTGRTVEGEPEFSVEKLVASFGVEPGSFEAVELVAGDDVIARADRAKWASVSSNVSFTLPRHMHGKVRVRIPAELRANDEATKAQTPPDALVSSVLVYRKTKPADRALAQISEDTDLSVALATSRD